MLIGTEVGLTERLRCHLAAETTSGPFDSCKNQ
jgi:hypothetical protein